ncbi:MAG: uracil-DNA glycosylase [Bacteroidia bacterium]|nr:uracil-DNA glycosylase [Bacteroidia bacterium]
MPNVDIEPEWKELLKSEFEKPYFDELVKKIKADKLLYEIYPPGKKIFEAFWLTPFSKVKVVILGQDPYHGPGQAHGLCFSVNEGVPFPPSLINIFKEIKDDLGHPIPLSGNLTPWALQGVFLLNAVLTVRRGQAGSHQNWGWEIFTDAVIQLISEKKQHVVFMLWGNYARKKGAFIDRQKHLVLEAPHPSPLARGGFNGCKHFSTCNRYLIEHGIQPINWKLNP